MESPKLGPGVRVLVADDNRDVADSLAMGLELLHHCEVVTAYGGREAIDLAETADPHVAVLDLDMPGTNGFQVAQVLRHRPGMLLIALTGNSSLAAGAQAQQAGFHERLLKPADLMHLAEVVQNIWRSVGWKGRP